MAKTLDRILRIVAAADARREREWLQEGVARRGLWGAPAPIHPRMGGPFAGKIRWKGKSGAG